MQVYLLEQTQGAVPAGNDWLCANEIISLNGMRFAKRRADWRLGRWTAKNAAASYLNLPISPCALARIEIRPASSGAPEVLVPNSCPNLTISLSHRAGTALCTVSPFRVKLGCDLEIIEPHSKAFVADYFTVEEQELVARVSPSEQPRIVGLLWSAKESALKALCEGLRLDTRSVSVRPAVGASDLFGWSPLQVRCTDGQIFRGWWRNTGNVLRTVVADPAPEPPISLKIQTHFPDGALSLMNHAA
jgi:4'-phosphopantetheinyl transferase